MQVQDKNKAQIAITKQNERKAKMDAVRFDKTRRIIELTEGLPDVACQLAYAYLQGLAEGRRLAQAETKKKKEADKDERAEV